MSKIYFGFESVEENEKVKKVVGVFYLVVSNYDLMNDLMLVGMYCVWKVFMIVQVNVCFGFKVFDIVVGIGDLMKLFVKVVGLMGEVWYIDINELMLCVGCDWLFDKGVVMLLLLCDVEKIFFLDNYFDVVMVVFGLCNMMYKDVVLVEMCCVMKFGGCVMVLEFLKVWDLLKKVYDLYFFKVLLWFGDKFVKDVESYWYFVEFIWMYFDQDMLKMMME